MKQIKNIWIFSKNRLWGTLGAILLAALFLGLLVFFIVKIGGRYDPEMTYVQLASLGAGVVLVALVLFWGMVDFGKNFDMMVGMGRTRKEFFFSYALVSFCSELVYAGIIVLISVLEEILCGIWYQGIPCELDMYSILVNPKNMGVVFLTVFSLHMLLGALYLKFRLKLFWVIWIVFSLSGAAMQSVGKNLHAGKADWLLKAGESMGKFFVFPAAVVLAVFAVATAAITMVSYNIVRKREIVCW